jgi:hypothetical protein
VRRRALLAFYSLSRLNPELLMRISGIVVKRLEDPYQSVVSAALVISGLFSGVRFSTSIGHKTTDRTLQAEMPQVVKSTVNDLLRKTLAVEQGYRSWFLLRILRTLFSLGYVDLVIIELSDVFKLLL